MPQGEKAEMAIQKKTTEVQEAPIEDGLKLLQRTYHLSKNDTILLTKMKDQIYAESNIDRGLDLSATLRGQVAYCEGIREKGGKEWEKLSAMVLEAKNPKRPGAVAASKR
jgi:hypothetical protein